MTVYFIKRTAINMGVEQIIEARFTAIHDCIKAAENAPLTSFAETGKWHGDAKGGILKALRALLRGRGE